MPRADRRLDDGCARERRAPEQLLGVGAGELRALVVDEVALRQRDDGGAHAEQLEDRDVLTRLRHDAVVAGDHDQREIDPRRPEIMVRTNRSCPGTSTTESERPEGSGRLA